MNNLLITSLRRIHWLALALAMGAFNTSVTASDPATPTDPMNFLVSQIEEMAQKRMKISEGFVTVSRSITKLRKDKEDDDAALKQVENTLGSLRDTYRKTETTTAWPITTDGVEYSKDMFEGLIKIKLASKRDLETRIQNCATLIARDNKTLGQIKLALELLNASEEKLKRAARDFNRDRVMPDMALIVSAVQSVDVDKIFRDAGIVGEKSTLDRAPDVSSLSSVSDDELTKFLKN